MKIKHNIIKPLGHIKGDPKRQIHSSKGLYLKVIIKSTKKGFEITEGWENKKKLSQNSGKIVTIIKTKAEPNGI